MKKMILSSILMLMPVTCFSGPYFRLIDPLHPSTSLGAFFDPTGKQTTSYGTSIALITHSTRDGAIFQSFQSDWTPLALGGGYANDTGFIAAGPSANFTPALKAVALSALNLVTKENTYLNLKSLLAPVSTSTPDISMSLGVTWFAIPIENHVFKPINKWKGEFRLFAGPAWKF